MDVEQFKIIKLEADKKKQNGARIFCRAIYNPEKLETVNKYELAEFQNYKIS